MEALRKKEESKCRVGTLTFHQSDNYGAVLQAYALQQVILNEKYDTEIINYYSEGIAYWNSYVKLNKFNFKAIAINIWKFTRIPRKWRFQSFRRKLKLSQQVTADTVDTLADFYDCYIVGSDQVWNCGCTFGDFTYFFDFVKDDSKKNSYAASFAYDNIPDEYLEKTTVHLNKFSHITVREKRGCELVKELTGKKAELVLDPVLLLDIEDWKKLIIPIQKKYIFVYQAEKSPSLIHYAKELSLKTKLPIYIVSTVWKGTRGRNIKDYSTCGPEKFLSLLCNAEYVVTNSFHGTALSIIFNKKFVVETLKNNNTNSRVYSILALFGLQNRIMTEKLNTDKINYIKANKILRDERKKSMDILKNILP